jgi:hypothetical protein
MLGGAFRIYVNSSIYNCFFDRCTVVGHGNNEGGAIHVQATDMNISFCTFVSCTSDGWGGGAISFSAPGSTTLRIEDSVFLTCYSLESSGNTGRVGGAIRIYNTGGYLKNCSFLNCISKNNGGGIAQVTGANLANQLLWLVDCIFAYNGANDRGGAVNIQHVAIKFSNCIFFHNSATYYGGAVAVDLTYSCTFESNVFARNFVIGCATRNGGGGVYIAPTVSTATLNFTNTIFYQNEYWDMPCGYSMFFFFYFYFFFIYLFIYFYFFLFFLDVTDVRVNPTCSVLVSGSYSTSYSSRKVYFLYAIFDFHLFCFSLLLKVLIIAVLFQVFHPLLFIIILMFQH